MTTTINVCDWDLEIDYEFIKGEDQEYDYPGSPDEVEIESICLNGDDIQDLMCSNLVREIETIILLNNID